MATIHSAPAAVPVSVAEAKAYLRIAGSDEDAVLGGFVRSATELCEAFTGLTLLQREVRQIVPASTCWTRLSATPVQAITGAVKLLDDGAEAPIDAGAYALDIDAAGDGWVRMTRPIDGLRRVKVTYAAGLGADWNGIPEALRHGIVRLTAELYARRHDEGDAQPPAAVTALWRPWRRIRLS